MKIGDFLQQFTHPEELIVNVTNIDTLDDIVQDFGDEIIDSPFGEKEYKAVDLISNQMVFLV